MIEEIEKIKKDINSSADSKIYQVEEEKDGRRILQIKSEIKFDINIAGIIKSKKPGEDEILIYYKRNLKAVVYGFLSNQEKCFYNC